MPSRTCWRHLIVFLASLGLLGGLSCGSSGVDVDKPEPKTFDTHEEAASSHIAVLSVERWEDAKDSFQPDFKLTEKDALEKSLAATRAIEEQFLDSLQVALRLRAAETGVLGGNPGGGDGGGGGDVGDGGDDGEGGGGDAGDGGDAEEEGEDGAGGSDLLDPSTLALLDPTVTEPGGTRPEDSVLDEELSTDPMLDYLAATALYQEVQMLNRYVDHAVQKTGYEPYLVRLQVSLLPRARWEPYDAYVWFSFFAGAAGASAPISTPIGLTPDLAPEQLESEDVPVLSNIREAEVIQEEVRSLFRILANLADLAVLDLKRLPEVLTENGFDFCQDMASQLTEQQTITYQVGEAKKTYPVRLLDWLAPDETSLQRLETVAGSVETADEASPEIAAQCLELLSLVRADTGADRAPIVIPLLVTDNLESTLRSRAIDRIRQFAFGLGFLLQSVGGEAEVTRFQRDLQTVLGQDFNSLLTVARLSDNSYGVRLGAMQQTGTKYATIPRTHNLTLLLLVPQTKEKGKACPIDYPTVQLISQTQLFHATEGEMLPGRKQSQVRKQLLGVAKKYKPFGLDFHDQDKKDQERILLHLLGLAQQNRSRAFRKSLASNWSSYFKSGTNINDFPFESFWLDLISIMLGSRQASTSFDLPRCHPPRFPCEQTALLVDDGNAATTLLRNGERLKPDLFRARLVVRDKGPLGKTCPGPTAPQLALPASKIEVTDKGTTTQLTFPSPKLWQVSLDKCSRVEIFCAKCKDPRDCPKPAQARTTLGSGVKFPVRSIFKKPKKEEPKAKVALRVPAKLIRADQQGHGSVTFEVKTQNGFKEKDNRARFDIHGADLVRWEVDPTEASESQSTAARRLKKPGVVTVHLRNLLPQSAVKIELFEITLKDATKTKKKDEAKSIATHELTVVSDARVCCGRSSTTTTVDATSQNPNR